MTKAWAIAWKDLRGTARNVPALAMMLVAPLAIAGLLGFAFGGSESFEIPATRVVLANEDAGSVAPGGGQAPPLAGDIFAGILTGEDLEDVLDVKTAKDAGTARGRVDDGDAAVAVIVPPDFTAALYGAGGESTAVELYVNPTQEFGAAIAESIVAQALLDFNGARAAATVAATMAGGSDGRDAAAQDAAVTFVRSGGEALVLTGRTPRAGEDEGEEAATVGVILAGMMVFFMFFGASNVARTIVTEDEDGTLPRMMTTPTPTGVILGGKFASTFLTVLAQLAVLLAGGALFFGIGWGRPDVVAILSVATAAVASGLALMIMGVVKTPGQAGAIGAGVYLVLALLGGNFTGTATGAGAYATVQGFTPNGPLLRGWDAAMRGGGLADVAGQLIVPLAFAAVFFAVAVWTFRRRYA